MSEENLTYFRMEANVIIQLTLHVQVTWNSLGLFYK